MTLDPVHFDGITSLAERISTDYDDTDQDDTADRLWETYLDPLYASSDKKDKVLYPIDSLERRRVSIEDIALADDEFETQHGLDSGTLNPREFANGLILDIGHAAMASVPSNLDLHRRRTLVAAVHSGDATTLLDDNWLSFDRNSSRGRVIQLSSDLQNHEREATHAYALYLSESYHLLENIAEVEDLLFLDGPLYPKGVIKWVGDDEPVIKDSEHTREIISNYAEIVDESLDADAPVVGFVKNMSSRQIVRRLREED
ncbi:MAG: DNA double-strand break repair nuclease NurA, partial [Halobacteria archaeon]|nr:DNA double-strand break repair nuclease NurA [Halobacteria archaeon]